MMRNKHLDMYVVQTHEKKDVEGTGRDKKSRSKAVDLLE